MNRLQMSSAAAGLFRALIARAGVPRDRILLTEFRSTDWQSLTFIGERHRLGLRIAGPDAVNAVTRLRDGLEEAEFTISRHIVADIAVIDEPLLASDGSIELFVEALTIAE